MTRGTASRLETEREQHLEEVLLVCPVRGPLGASALAKDGLTSTEEARRVDFLHFLVNERNYPPDHIRVEVVTLKNLGESGRNQLRADVIVYDRPWAKIINSDKKGQLGHAILVAEIKRFTRQRGSGVSPSNLNQRSCSCHVSIRWECIGTTRTETCSRSPS